MRLIVLALISISSVRAAFAGECDARGAAQMVGELEAYAASAKAPKPDIHHICMETAGTIPRLVARTVTACTTILAREPTFADCVEWPVKFGKTKLDGIALFDKVGELFPLEPFTYGSQTLALYDRLGDARALPLITAAWQAALADKRATQPRHAHTFLVWRHAAVAIFAKLGGATERAFLEEQAKTVRDRGLAKAINKAIAAIAAR